MATPPIARLPPNAARSSLGQLHLHIDRQNDGVIRALDAHRQRGWRKVAVIAGIPQELADIVQRFAAGFTGPIEIDSLPILEGWRILDIEEISRHGHSPAIVIGDL